MSKKNGIVFWVLKLQFETFNKNGGYWWLQSSGSGPLLSSPIVRITPKQKDHTANSKKNIALFVTSTAVCRAASSIFSHILKEHCLLYQQIIAQIPFWIYMHPTSMTFKSQQATWMQHAMVPPKKFAPNSGIGACGPNHRSSMTCQFVMVIVF